MKRTTHQTPIRVTILLLFSLIGLISCSLSNSRNKLVQKIEQLQPILFEENQSVIETAENRTKMITLRSDYKEFIRTYPKDTLRSEYLYNLAMMEADFFKEYQESVTFLAQFYREYPNHPNAAKALFLQAFTYSEYVKDYDRAKLVYEQFLQKYPSHELVPSIQFELENLGKSPEELLNSKLKAEN